MRPLFKTLATVLVTLITVGAATAQTEPYPSRPLKLVVPFPAGSALDATARDIGLRVGEALGQPIVVENRVGANGIIGADAVAKSRPDGYTLLLTTPSTHVTSRFLMKSVPFDPTRDFTPIMAAVEPVTVLVAASSLPVSNVRELIDLAKRQPGKLAFGSSGSGSVFHLAGELFGSLAGLDLVHVPYKGTAPAVQALVGGQVPLALTALGDVLPFVRSGQVKLLAVLEGKRYGRLPEVPSIVETLPAFEKPATWFGIFAPAGLPQPVLRRLHGEMARALGSADLRSRLEDRGLSVVANTPEQFEASMRASTSQYERLIRAAGLQPE
ncbi:MAG: tripartite tricarboxylate transporter substrate binding protein [Ramlibacter sp.]|uniref:Bug family tripartite tricarboxylate transporter substrate binding protein n=1 Tax=Ramlibacter sp. TaxID=1917967 RepID=UPI00262851C3|nr:tripartite tricarboxylate transporter substrate binding protein [Ramlibacter sp.]MDH4378140.1 tripartite tricarboxylate transporter substrate binding protein [Ramlibacter sp.]